MSTQIRTRFLKEHNKSIIIISSFAIIFGITKVILDTFDLFDLLLSSIAIIAGILVLHLYKVDTKWNVTMIIVLGIAMTIIGYMIPVTYSTCSYVTGQCGIFSH